MGGARGGQGAFMEDCTCKPSWTTKLMLLLIVSDLEGTTSTPLTSSLARRLMDWREEEEEEEEESWVGRGGR